MSDYLAQALETIIDRRNRAKKAERKAEGALLALLETILQKRDWEQLLEIPEELFDNVRLQAKLGLLVAHLLNEGRDDIFTSLRERVGTEFLRKPLLKNLVELDVTWDRVQHLLPSEGLNYFKEILKVDKVELLASYLALVPIHHSTYCFLGHFFAKNCMDLLGYEDHKQMYLYGALDKQNIECVRWLLSKAEATRDHLMSDFLLAFSFDSIEMEFAAKIVQAGLITLTNEEWNAMRENNTKLYEKLYNDV